MEEGGPAWFDYCCTQTAASAQESTICGRPPGGLRDTENKTHQNQLVSDVNAPVSMSIYAIKDFRVLVNIVLSSLRIPAIGCSSLGCLM